MENNGIVVEFCPECGFHHQIPLPDSAAIKKYYEDDAFYKTHSPTGWFDKEVREHKHGLWNAYYDYKINLLKMYNQQVYTKTPLLLDVGCGSGFFLKRAVDRHYHNVWGYEPSSTARAVNNLWYVKEHDNWGKVENVHLSLVLEHLIDPADELKKWYDKMTYNRRIMIVVPNDLSPLQAKLGTNHFISNVHINYFTPLTLWGLMERTGFKVEHYSTTFPMELFPLTGLDYRKSAKTGSYCHEARLRFEQVFGTRAFDFYQKVFTPKGWGREIIMVGRKD